MPNAHFNTSGTQPSPALQVPQHWQAAVALPLVLRWRFLLLLLLLLPLLLLCRLLPLLLSWGQLPLTLLLCLAWHLLLLLLLLPLLLQLLSLHLLLRCRLLRPQHHCDVYGLQLWAGHEQTTQHLPLRILAGAPQIHHSRQPQACWGWRCGPPGVHGRQLLQGPQHPPIFS
jgi:hypothetical protein